MVNMKKLRNRILIIVLTIVMVVNLFVAPISYAQSDEVLTGGLLDGILGGLIGILTIPERLVAVLIGNMLNVFTARVAYADGSTDAAINGDTITPFDILFNKVMLTDVDFTNVTASNAATPDRDLVKDFQIGSGDITRAFRANIAAWYYTMRMIAAAILLVILIYVGIRMLISTVASERAKYKKMLVDWVTSLCLLFLLQYIIAFVIIINNAIVSGLEQIGNANEMDDSITTIKTFAFSLSHLLDPYSIAAAAAYLLLMWQTLTLFFTYFNRMLKLAFLVIISPLITLTYSIDKIGDGKAQALGTWLNEYIFGVLIQPFHCAIYMMFVGTAMDQFVNSGGIDQISNVLASSIVVVVSIQFIKKAESIVREIFAFKDDSSHTSLASGVATAAFTMQMLKGAGGAAKSIAGGIKNASPALKNAFQQGRINAVMGADAVKGALGIGAVAAATSGTGGTTTTRDGGTVEQHGETEEKKAFAERYKQKRREVEERLNKKDADKMEKKLKGKTGDLSDAINKKKNDLLAQSGGNMTEQEALQQARKEVLQREKKKRNFVNRNKTIRNARKGVAKFRSAMGSSALVGMAKDTFKRKAAVGVGVAFGAGALDSNGDFFKAVMTGAAAMQGARTFLGDSKVAQVQSANSNFSNILDSKNQNLGSRIAAVEQITGEEDKYKSVEAVEKELDKILKDLAKMEGSGFTDETTRSKVKNQIVNRINNGSGSAAEAIDEIFGQENISDPDGIAKAKIKEYVSKKAIYDQFSAFKANGGTVTQFAKESMGLSDKVEFFEEAEEAANYTTRKFPPVDSIKQSATLGKAEQERKMIAAEERKKELEEARERHRDDLSPEKAAEQKEAEEAIEDAYERAAKEAAELAAKSPEEAYVESQVSETMQKVMQQATDEAAEEMVREQEAMLDAYVQKAAAELDEEAQEKIKRMAEEKKKALISVLEERASQYVIRKQQELDERTVAELEECRKRLQGSSDSLRQKQAELLGRRLSRISNYRGNNDNEDNN